MSAVTVEEIYNQARQLSEAERQQLFGKLLEDLAPEPPHTFYDDEELTQMLRAGLSSGPAAPMTETDWSDIRQEVRARAARRAETLSSQTLSSQTLSSQTLSSETFSPHA